MDSIHNQWFSEINSQWKGQAMSLQVKKVLLKEKSQFQDMLVFESESHGRVFVLDNCIQLTDKDEFAYHEMISHLPMTSLKQQAKKVLIIGGGDGGAIRELCRYPHIEEIHMCEIDPKVPEVSLKFFPHVSQCLPGGKNEDPRVKIHYMDGALFLKEHKNEFDLIIVDSSDPVGPAKSLFQAEFYQTIHDALTDDGVACTQGECIWLPNFLDLIKDIVSFNKKIFETVEYSNIFIPTYPNGCIGFFLCSKQKGHSCKKPVRDVPNVTKEFPLRYYNKNIHKASFVLPQFAHNVIEE